MEKAEVEGANNFIQRKKVTSKISQAIKVRHGFSSQFGLIYNTIIVSLYRSRTEKLCENKLKLENDMQR